MLLEISNEDVFVPEFNGNRDLPEDEQIKVYLNMPTKSIQAAVKPDNKLRMEFDKDGNPTGGFVEAEVREEIMFRKMIRSIDNCAYKSNGKVVHVREAKDLAGVPVQYSPLVDEISKELQRRLFRQESEDYEKN